jgi:hypothetical protein
MENEILNIANDFLNKHQVKITKENCSPNWHAELLLDGKTINTAMLKKIIIPIVFSEIGPHAAAVKSIIWKILIRANNESGRN